MSQPNSHQVNAMPLSPTHECDVTEDEAWQLMRWQRYDEDFYRTIYFDDRPGDPFFRADFRFMRGKVVCFVHRNTPIVTARVLDCILPEEQEAPNLRHRVDLYFEGYLVHKRQNISQNADRVANLEPGFNDIERAFALEWQEQCQPNVGLNYGHGLLQDLFLGQRDGRPEFTPRLLNDREHIIAATAIQWLGTNCGRSFLLNVNRRTNNLLAEIISCRKEPATDFFPEPQTA